MILNIKIPQGIYSCFKTESTRTHFKNKLSLSCLTTNPPNTLAKFIFSSYSIYSILTANILLKTSYANKLEQPSLLYCAQFSRDRVHVDPVVLHKNI